MNVHRLHALDDDEIARLVTPPPAERGPAPTLSKLRVLMQALQVRRSSIIAIVLVSMLCATVVVFRTTPLFSASALIMVAPVEAKTDDQRSVLAGLANDSMTVENQVQFLTSASLAQRVIKKLNLDRDAEFSGARDGGGIFGMLLSFVGLRERAGSTAQGQVDPILRQHFADRLTVSIQGHSSVIRVTFYSADRAKAAKIADAVADQYIADQREAAFGPSAPSADHGQRLTQLAEQARADENAVEQFKSSNGLQGAIRDRATPVQPSAELSGQIAHTRSALTAVESKFRQLNTLYHSGGADSVARMLNSPALVQLRGHQAELVRKEAELSTKYGERHPEIIALKGERASVDKKIDEEVRRIIQIQARQVNGVRARLASLEQGSNTTQPAPLQAAQFGDEQGSAQLRELERRAAASRADYQALAAGATDTPHTEQGQTPDAREIEAAAVPREPIFPNKPLILGLTLLGSTLVGILYALLRERLENGFRTGAEIERKARVSNLAVVPSVARGRDVIERVMQKPQSGYAEALRSLLTSVQLHNAHQPPKVLLVTSSVPSEGKTSIAVSLGRLAARGGARVILVDGDMRNPSVAEQFTDRKAEVGLIDVLTGKRDLATILQRDPISPLEFLPVAKPPANPADLISSQALKNLIAVLRLHYDLVILDAAPMLPVADTGLLSRLADKVVYVVRWNKTPREAVMHGLKMLRDVGADIAGTVLNQADLRRHAIYGYGYPSRGYGKYYSE